jgi:hypothetical protein
MKVSCETWERGRCYTHGYNIKRVCLLAC